MCQRINLAAFKPNIKTLINKKTKKVKKKLDENTEVCSEFTEGT